MLKEIKESAAYLVEATNFKSFIGIILGSGLGDFAREIQLDKEILYHDIPHFPISSIEGHKGAILFGKYNGQPVMIMQGRVHYYEGYSMQQVTYPIRVMKQMGVHTLLLSNAAGGMNPDFSVGDLMIITDHIHLMPNPLVGEKVKDHNTWFFDMKEAYDKGLIATAMHLSAQQGLSLKRGVYIGVIGPTYETPAEYKFFRMLGGDAVGMSTTPEVIVARQLGIRCFAVSVITDLGIPGKIKFLSHEMVKTEASAAEPRLAELFKAMISTVN